AAGGCSVRRVGTRTHARRPVGYRRRPHRYAAVSRVARSRLCQRPDRLCGRWHGGEDLTYDTIGDSRVVRGPSAAHYAVSALRTATCGLLPRRRGYGPASMGTETSTWVLHKPDSVRGGYPSRRRPSSTEVSKWPRSNDCWPPPGWSP